MWYVKKTGINYVDNINLDNLQPIYHSLLLKKKVYKNTFSFVSILCLRFASITIGNRNNF